ncbi:hypothetical protein D9M70_202980 [compost metagenome]
MHAEHALEGVRLVAGRFRQPVRRVVDDGAQAVGAALERFDESEDAGFAGKIRGERRGAAFAQEPHAVAFSAVADDHRLAFVQQAFGTVEADALAGAGDEDGSGSAH